MGVLKGWKFPLSHPPHAISSVPGPTSYSFHLKQASCRLARHVEAQKSLVHSAHGTT
jgi:hypothetical protein